jgi:transcriptional regulator with XRE-family HTH domain
MGKRYSVKSSDLVKRDVNSRIKHLRLITGLSQRDFAGSIGLSQGHLSVIEKGDQSPSEVLLMALCYRHKVHYDWLYSGKGKIFEDFFQDRGIPVYYQLPEGYPEFSGTKEIQGYISLPSLPENGFALFQRGDYMAPTVRDQDLLILEPASVINKEDMVLVRNKWGTSFIRRFRESEGKAVLSADNIAYSAFDYDPLEQKMVARVTQVMRKVNY